MITNATTLEVLLTLLIFLLIINIIKITVNNKEVNNIEENILNYEKRNRNNEGSN